MFTKLTLTVLASFASWSWGVAALGAYEQAQLPLRQLPQEHDYQKTLRAFLATLTEDDFTVEPQALTVVPTNDPDELFRLWLLTLHPPKVSAARLPAAAFTLAAIESGPGLVLPAAPLECQTLAWLAKWPYPGNPYRGAKGLQRRAFLLAAVDLMMLDYLYEHDPQGADRADYLGGNLIWLGYTYAAVQDGLPPAVRTAFAAGLKKLVLTLQRWGPKGLMTDMDLFAPVGLWYIAQALNEAELRRIAEEYARPLFTDARFERFAAAIHTGPVGGIHQEWQRPYGFGGGALCAFWTPAAGPVLLARRRGVQGAVFDSFDEWRLWPVHAVTGLTASGDLVTSTRIQQPEVEARCSATSADVRVAGIVPKYVAARQETVATDLRYERRFRIDAEGVRIQTDVIAAGAERPAELYETIPVFLQETAKQPIPAITFQVGSVWREATPAAQTNVSGLKIERGDGQVQVTFARPVTARLSPAVWQDGFQTRAQCRTVLIDLLSTGGPAALGFSVAYTISAYGPPGTN